MLLKAKVAGAEQALYRANKTFQALRSVAFLLSQTEGSGPSDWEGQPMEDLESLLAVLADHGIESTDSGFEALQSISSSDFQVLA